MYLQQDMPIERLGLIDLREFGPINYLAIELLEQLGNFEPTQEEIDHIEKLIKENLKKLVVNLKGEEKHNGNCASLSVSTLNRNVGIYYDKLHQ